MAAGITHFYTYETHVKQRWRSRAILDMLVAEFRTRTKEYYIDALDHRVITVNGKPVTPGYKLKDLDVIHHTVHFHEPPQPKIEIIKEEEDYVVVNKPAGIPVHPTGGYVYYSVTKTLFGDRKVGCINRLDMPVSGVLIVVLQNNEKTHDLLDDATKIYIAKVKGDFPDFIEVDKPIGSTGTLVNDISDSGKPSRTIFRNIESRNGFSLVECQPITGRTHQIRIHLKHLGFPILNDILYGDGSAPEVPASEMAMCNEDISMYEDQEKYECVVKYCKGENNRSYHIKDSFICLHAWKYRFNSVTYEAPWPTWATL